LSSQLPTLQDSLPLEREAACCSKSRHKKLVTILEMTIKGIKGASENEHFLWDKDGKDGENDSNTSMIFSSIG
jgi:hypothetical protein